MRRFSKIMTLCAFAVAADLFADGPITRCDELAALADDALHRTYCLTGQVLQVNRTSRATELILRDDTGTARLTMRSRPSLAVGDIVVFEERPRTNNSPIASTRILDHRPLPAPIPAQAADVLSGRHDWKRVRVQGKLQDVLPSDLNHEWCCLTLNGDGTSVQASTPNTGDLIRRLTALTDAVIEIDGVVLPHDGSPRTKIGRILRFAGIGDIRVKRPPSADPFDKPDIAETYGLSPSVVSTLGRHSVRGRILACWDDCLALLRTPRGEFVKISTGIPHGARPGEFVEAVGLPESDLHHINLTAATLRPSEPFELIELPATDFPRSRPGCAFNMQQIVRLHGHVVRLAGVARNLPMPESSSRQFHLDIDGQLVPVNFGSADSARLAIRSGSRVEISGVLVLSIESWSPRTTFPRILGFFIVLRSADDVRILAQPSWWTTERLTIALGTLFAFLVSVLIWNLSLRHLATRKGRELFREQLGHVKADLRTEERTRLAVELHDTLAQNLTGVSMEIEAANDLRGEAPQAMLDRLGIAAKALKSCRDELRNCLWDLRSQALDEKDMTTAILRTLRPHVSDSQLSVRFNVPRSRLSDNTAHALLRIIRELVVNAIRHGNASAVKVAGTLDGDKLLCSVTDNGQGFDPDAAPGVLQGHFGLQGIRERIDELGGHFTLVSTLGKGTKATIVVPIPLEAHPDKV